MNIVRLSLFCLALILLNAGGAESMPDLSAMNRLNDVVPEFKDGRLRLRLEFEKPLARYSAPEFFNKSVQIDFSQAYIQPAKKYFPTGDSEVTQVYASQFSPNVLRLRLIMGDEAGDLADRFQLEKNGRSLTISFNKNDRVDILDHFLSRAAHKAESDERAEQEITQEPEAEEQAVARNEVLSPVTRPQASEVLVEPSPSKISSQKQETEKTFGSPDRGKFGTRPTEEAEPLSIMSTGMRMVTMLSLVLGLIFLLFFIFKKYVLKNTLFGGGEKLIKVLATGYLAPKKNIALVEIAGEILVLGISNDNISLLANIREEERIEKIKSSEQKPGSGSSLFSGSESVARDSILAGAPRSIQGFAKYLKQFSGKDEGREQSVAAVTDQIRRKMGRIKTA